MSEATAPVVTNYATFRGAAKHTSYDAARGLRVQVDGATEDENRRWERALRRHAAACGCEFGAAALLAVAVAFGLTRGLSGARVGSSSGREIAVWIALGFGAAFVGKLIGLLRSRLVLRRVGAQIAAVAGETR